MKKYSINSFFICRCQRENLGDLIINKMLVDELCRFGVVYIDANTMPEKFKSHLFENPNAIDIWSYNNCKKNWISRQLFLFRFFKNNRIRIITSSPGPGYLKKSYSLLSSVILRVRRFVLSKYNIYQIDIGSCCSNFAFHNSRINDNYSDKYYFRSYESSKYYKSIYPNKSVDYIPDLSFLIHYYIQKKQVKKRIAVLDFRVIENNKNDLIEWVGKIVNALVQQSITVIFYYQVELDRQFTELLYDSYKHLTNVYIHKELVWYENLSFFEDKLFVISNRMHSLLTGIAFGAYPICLYHESASTIKIKHSFSSYFSSNIPIIFREGDIPESSFDELLNQYSQQIDAEFIYNSKLCRSTIDNIISTIKC